MHLSVCKVRLGGGGRQEQLPCKRAESLGAGIRVSSDAVWDGVGKGLGHKHLALLWPKDVMQGGEGDTKQLQRRKVLQATCGSAPPVTALASQQQG